MNVLYMDPWTGVSKLKLVSEPAEILQDKSKLYMIYSKDRLEMK